MDNTPNIIPQLEALNPEEGRRYLGNLSQDAAARVLEALGSARTLDILEGAGDQERQTILDLVPPALRMRWIANGAFAPRTVGRFIDPTDAELPPSTRVDTAIEMVRELAQREFVTYLFVVDDERRLIGIVAMRDLLLASAATQIGTIMIPSPFALLPELSLEDAMGQVVKKHFPVYPVVDLDGIFLGLVRGARLFEAQAVEISAQPGAMVGVEKEERLGTVWQRSFRLRHPWLQINLLTAFLAGGVVSFFQGTIDELVILASFLPVLAGQSGNTGCQALAVTIRGVTLGDYKDGAWGKLVRKEAMLGVMNGFFVGLIAGGGMYFMATLQGHANAVILSIVVVAAMVGSCVISGVSGVLVPITLKRFGFDPATASSIFLTTATDVASMGMLLGLATIFVL